MNRYIDRKDAIKIVLALLAVIFIFFALSNNIYSYDSGVYLKYDTNNILKRVSPYRASFDKKIDYSDTSKILNENKPSFFISDKKGFSILNNIKDSQQQVDESVLDITENKDILEIEDFIDKQELIDEETGLTSITGTSDDACSISHSGPFHPVLINIDNNGIFNIPSGVKLFLPVFDKSLPDYSDYQLGFSIQRLGDGSVDIFSHNGNSYPVSEILNIFDFHSASVVGGYTFLGGHTLLEYKCDTSCEDKKGDLNNDGNINTIDLSLAFQNYGCRGSSCLGDLDSDGFLGMQDIIILSENFGSYCKGEALSQDSNFVKADESYSPIKISYEIVKPSTISPYNFLVEVKNTGSSRLRSLQTENLIPEIFNIYKSYAPLSGDSSISSKSKIYIPSLYRDQSITYSFLVSFSDSTCRQITTDYDVANLYGLCGRISDSILNSNNTSIYIKEEDDRTQRDDGLDPDYFFDDGSKEEDISSSFEYRNGKLQIQSVNNNDRPVWVHPRDKIIIKGY